MKKHLNVDMIQSELRGGSAFFPGYQGRHSPAPSAAPEASHGSSPSTMDLARTTPVIPAPKSGVKKPDKPGEAVDNIEGVPPPVPRTGPRTDPLDDGQLVPKVKRTMKQRQPFDIYEDQYVRLKRIADSERGFVNGRGLSQMVREAIDAYLAAHPSQSKK